MLPFRPGPFTWRKVLLVVGLFAWAFAVSVLGIGGSIKDAFFAWMPQWALDPIPKSFAGRGDYHREEVVAAFGYLMILVTLGPFVEELYFRGYLMPRIGRFGGWAALINVSLFACYHLWKPWDSLNLILILGPMVYAVWRPRTSGSASPSTSGSTGWAGPSTSPRSCSRLELRHSDPPSHPSLAQKESRSSWHTARTTAEPESSESTLRAQIESRNTDFPQYSLVSHPWHLGRRRPPHRQSSKKSGSSRRGWPAPSAGPAALAPSDHPRPDPRPGLAVL